MIYAQKGNKVKQIAEADIQRYVEQGFQITDGQGTVLRETVPTDLPTLRTSYAKHVAEIKQLKEQIRQLRDQVNTLSTLRTEPEPKEQVETATAESEEKVADKKTRSRKNS